MIEKKNEISIFEEFRIKTNIISNKKIKDHFPSEDSLKRLNVLQRDQIHSLGFLS